MPGWLGEDNPLHFYQLSISAEAEMPCHKAIDYSDKEWKTTQLPEADLCAGSLIYFRNHLKSPRRLVIAAAVQAVKQSAAVFSWPHEWFQHHMPLATEEERKAAVLRSQFPPMQGDI
jgi:hypothetical protein